MISDATLIYAFHNDSEERNRNFRLVSEYFKEIFNNIYVGSDQELDINKSFSFFKFNNSYHRTKIYNELIYYCKTKYVIAADTDVYLKYEYIYDALKLLESGFHFVNPYARLNFLNPKYTSIGFDKILESEPGCESCGGFCIFNRREFIKNGMYNEEFKHWGCEDFDIRDRFNKLNKWGHTDNLAFHLHHPKINEGFYNESEIENNHILYRKLLTLSDVELELYKRNLRNKYIKEYGRKRYTFYKR